MVAKNCQSKNLYFEGRIVLFVILAAHGWVKNFPFINVLWLGFGFISFLCGFQLFFISFKINKYINKFEK